MFKLTRARIELNFIAALTTQKVDMTETFNVSGFNPGNDFVAYDSLIGSIFYSLKEAQIVIERWRKHYNTVRPHSALNYRPPAPQTFAPLAHHLDEIVPMQ